jgi:hypothetical protein
MMVGQMLARVADEVGGRNSGGRVGKRRHESLGRGRRRGRNVSVPRKPLVGQMLARVADEAGARNSGGGVGKRRHESLGRGRRRGRNVSVPQAGRATVPLHGPPLACGLPLPRRLALLGLPPCLPPPLLLLSLACVRLTPPETRQLGLLRHLLLRVQRKRQNEQRTQLKTPLGWTARSPRPCETFPPDALELGSGPRPWKNFLCSHGLRCSF